MTTYRQIHGRSIQAVTTDPSETVAEGQIWYNTTSDTFKSVLVAEAFSSAPNLPSIAFRRTGFGVQTAGVVAGGSSTSTNRLTVTEEYNGSGYSVGGTLTTGRRLSSGAGTQTAGLFYLGAGPSSDSDVSVLNETYDGTSYSEVGDLTTARQGAAGDGTQTAAFAAGGSDGSGNPSAVAETWDGSSWTNLPSINTTRRFLSGSGSPSAAVVFGGEVTPSGPDATRKATEEYDGSSWTTVNSMNSGAGTHGSSGGSQTDVISFAGRRGSTVDNAENYNGTTWSASPATLALARSMTSGLGSGTAALCATGETQPGPYTNVSEEYNKSVNVITAGAWASATAMNTGRGRFGASGGKDSALAAGGYTVPSNTSNTEKYDGTSWTESGNLPVAKNSFPLIGSQTASIACGGYTPPTYSNASDIFDGSSWTSAPTMGTGRESAAGSTASPYNAVVVYGGYAAAAPNIAGLTEEFNGSAWSEQSDMPTALLKNGGGGTQTAAISSGGAPPASNLTQFYDGTNWTTGPATLLNTQQWHGYAGTQTANFIFGGSTNPDSNASGISQVYDGSSWATAPNLTTSRYAVGGSGQGTPTSASAFGGLISPIGPGAKNFTEEFTGETTAVNVKTLTQS
tara:strand:+ start:1136 stop:3010 length:1875 start_codon:yes stop_codon:yes gene_type:complete